MKINSRYTDEWRLINELSISWPWEQQEIYAALEQEEYEDDVLRASCDNPKSPLLKELLSNLSIKIPQLLSEMCDQEHFMGDIWNIKRKEEMLNNTFTTCCILKDKPGFTTDIHIDCRTTVCVGMVFFNSYDDPNQATTFYTTQKGDNPLRISSEYGKGWYSANTHYGYHCGGNNSQRDRYAIQFCNILTL